MRKHKWEAFNPTGPLCELCGVAKDTQYEDMECTGRVDPKDVEIDELKSHLTHLQANHTKLTESTAALLARCVALEERARVRDTREDECPRDGEIILMYKRGRWRQITYYMLHAHDGHLWLPAPPDPETK